MQEVAMAGMFLKERCHTQDASIVHTAMAILRSKPYVGPDSHWRLPVPPFSALSHLGYFAYAYFNFWQLGRNGYIQLTLLL